jgi:hypothetical protein
MYRRRQNFNDGVLPAKGANAALAELQMIAIC